MEAKAIRVVLDKYHDRIAKENHLIKSLPFEQGFQMRDEFLLPIGEEVGQFLNSLIKGCKAKSILEIGTSYGYSTLWLAEAAKTTGGQVFSLEIDPKKSAYAEAQLKLAGLYSYVTFIVADAVGWIKESMQLFDFVLLDVWKELYVPCFLGLEGKIKKGGFLIADNMIHPPHHKKETDEYRARILEHKQFQSILLPLGAGIEVSTVV